MIAGSNPLADVDAKDLLELLPQKISFAKRLVADSAIDVAALEANPFATDADRTQSTTLYNARKYQLDHFEGMLKRLQSAARGETPGKEEATNG